jgi:hypothetical protein
MFFTVILGIFVLFLWIAYGTYDEELHKNLKRDNTIEGVSFFKIIFFMCIIFSFVFTDLIGFVICLGGFIPCNGILEKYKIRENI